MQLSRNIDMKLEITSFRSLSRLPCGNAGAVLRERL
jgi:hypothetical protein